MVSVREFIKCPQCGGADIVYSCEPKCCFNHVCGDCRSSFQINTHRTGEFDRATAIEVVEPQSAEPTTGCANCGSLRVGVMAGDGQPAKAVCADCRAVLTLAFEEFVPGQS